MDVLVSSDFGVLILWPPRTNSPDRAAQNAIATLIRITGGKGVKVHAERVESLAN